MARPLLAPVVLAVAAGIAAGCGGSGTTTAPTTTAPTTTAPTTTAPPLTTTAATAGTTTSPSPGPTALQAEANGTAAGDIPDNQVFLVFANRAAGYSIKYPEGWAQQGSGNRVVFRDKNNIVRIVVGAGAPFSKPSVQADLALLTGAKVQGAPQATTVAGAPAFKAVYGSESAANAVTGKRVRLIVARYFLWQAGRRAVVDLGTPEGVDNVDAYRLMIESFRWL